MPSIKVLEQKKAVVAQLVETMKAAKGGVFVDYKGITVEDDTKLRRELREAGVEYSVVKNTLTRFAANELGITGLDEILNGTTAMAVSNTDPIAPAKVLAKFAKTHPKFVLKAGFMDGVSLDEKQVKIIAELPSKEQLLTQLLSVLNGNIRGLACALNAIAEQKGE